MEDLITFENITQYIHIIRGQKVMLDFDLARLYSTETSALKRQVRTNIERFPKDFMVQLNRMEWNELMQKLHKFEKLKHTPSLPFAFTEHGVTMLSSVLKSKQAVQVNIKIVRTFIELRSRIINYEDLLRKIDKLEEDSNQKYFKHDQDIKLIFELIEKMIAEEDNDDRKIGFDVDI